MDSTLAIIWDFDGTLAYRHGMWGQCLADLASEYLAEPFRREHFAPYLSKGFPWHMPEISHAHLQTSDQWWNALQPLLVAALVNAANLKAREAHRLAAKVRERYTDASTWSVFPDAAPALDSLSCAGWMHVLLSNHVPELPSLVESLGLARHFVAILTSAKLGYEKPRSECFRAALDQLPIAQRVVVIGDSHAADMVGARTLGLEGILVRARPQGAYMSFDSLDLLVRHLNTGAPAVDQGFNIVGHEREA